MELRLTTIVVAFAFIGLVTCVPTRHPQQPSHQNQRTGASSEADVVRLLAAIDQQVKDDVSKDTPRQFSELVARLSQLEHSVISSIDRQVRSQTAFASRKLEDIWNDALIMDASEGSLKLITQQILDSSVSQARKNYLLSMMPFIQAPSAGAVRAVLPLLQAKHVQRHTVLSVSALIANARRSDSLQQKDLADAVSAIVQYLKQHESSSDKVTVALKALHNLHYFPEDVALVTKFAADGKQSKSVRLAALEALADYAADDFVAKKVDKIYNDASESAEIRIAAYKVIVSHADAQVVSRIVSSLNREADKQVGAFVSSHLANLKETAAPRHQQIKLLLAHENIPTERFPSDLRKYSRNVELSQQGLGVGAVLDGDLIYDHSVAPRSLRLNLSLPLHHREMNLVEVSFRQEGLESEMEKLLAPNGPFAGKNMKQMVSHALEYLQSGDMSNRIQYRKSLARTASSNDLDLSMAVKLDGNTVAYLDIADLTSSQTDMHMILNKLKEHMSSNWAQDRAFAFKFDRTFEIPSEKGPKSVSVNGSAVFGFKVDKSGLWPSMAMELSTKTPEKHIVQKIYSSPSLKFVVEGHKITLKFADKQMNIISFSNEAFDIDSQGHETPIVVPQRSFEHCSNALSKAVGMQVCAKFTGPKSLWSDKAPCYAQWTMDISVMKVDSKMTGWQFGFENKRNNYRVTFDTPRSSIKRNVALEVEALDELTGLRGKIELPKRSMEMSAGYAYSKDEMIAKVQVKGNESEKYSLAVGLKSKKNGSQKSEWSPLLRIESPASKPTTLTGSFSYDAGRKKSMAFELHNDMQGAERKSIKGSITSDGSLLKDLKLSASLQAQIDSITMRLFSTTDKKRDGSAQTDVKVEYKLPNTREHSAEFVGKIQNLDASGESLKMNSFVELRTTQFPEKNVHVSWNMQHKPRENLENEFTVMWRDQMNDPKRKMHLLHTVKLTGVKNSAVTATCDNFASIDIAPLNIKYEVKAFGSYQRSGAPNHKLSLDVHDKVNKNIYGASWEYRHLSASPLKMSIDASVRVNDRSYRYSDKIEEIAPRAFKGATELQWAKDKKANINYVLKRQTERTDQIFQLNGDVKVPSLPLIQHSGIMIVGPRSIRFNTEVNHGSDKLWDVAGLLSKDQQSEAKFTISNVKGQMWIKPFGAEKSAHLSFDAPSVAHVSDVTATRGYLQINSKTLEGKKVLVGVVGTINGNIIAGPHDMEVRFAGKSGERKVRMHHAIGDSKADTSVAYFVKNQEQGKFESYVHQKSVQPLSFTAGVSFKTAAKYQKYDGFKVQLVHEQRNPAPKVFRTTSTLNAELTDEQKVGLALETETSSSQTERRGFAKVVIDTPVFDFKHQEAQFEGILNDSGFRVAVNAVTNEKKNLRFESEVKAKLAPRSYRLSSAESVSARVLAESEIHGAKYEAELKGDSKSADLTVRSNGKVVLHTDGTVAFRNPRDLSVSFNGKVHSYPTFAAVMRAEPKGNKVEYSVTAAKDDKTFATGKMDLDLTDGCNVLLKMHLTRDNIKFQYKQIAARDIISGPHEITVVTEGDHFPREIIAVSHKIVDNKLQQSVSYAVADRQVFQLNSDVFYQAKRQSGADKHTCNVDIVMQVERDSYRVKHDGEVAIGRDFVEFSSSAQWQDKQVWASNGRFGKSGKQTIEFMVLDHSGKMECSPYAETKIAKLQVRSKRYSHSTNMEANSNKWLLKLDSKATLDNDQLYTLDITRVPQQPNSLNLQSKWFDVKMDADVTRSPVTASFSSIVKDSSKSELKGQLTASGTRMSISGESKCAHCKKWNAKINAERSSSGNSMDLLIEENNRDRFSVDGSLQSEKGFRANLICKNHGKELIAARVNIDSQAWNGPNEMQVTLDAVETIKLRHEKMDGKRHTVTLEHLRGGARKNFAQVSGEMEITSSIVDAKVFFQGELEKRLGKVKTIKMKLNHRQEMAKSRPYVFASRAEATINNSPFTGEIRWELDPKGHVTLQLSSESPIHKFEKQDFSFEGKWKKQLASVASKLSTSAGCSFRVNGEVTVDAKRATRVSGDMLLETPKKNFKRQQAALTASWDESTAEFKVNAVDAKQRKLDISGQSEIKAGRVYARGQCDSDFSFIKSSFVEVKGERESANVIVKYNDQMILEADAKGKWTNPQKFDILVQGKARSSPLFTVTVSANKVASVLSYTLSGKRDEKVVASVEVTSDVSDSYKFTADASFPILKVKGSMKSDFSSKPAHGPHSLQVSFESDKLGAHSASLTHKIQGDRVKCALHYTRDGKVRVDLQHSGEYRWSAEQGKLYMDADLDCKIDERAFSLHHAGEMEMKRHHFTLSSKAQYNRKPVWACSCKLSRREASYLKMEAAQREVDFAVDPFAAEKTVQMKYRSPVYNHETSGRLNVRTWEASLQLKSLKQSQKMMDLSVSRRADGVARMSLESLWADARAEYDVAKKPMTAHVLLKTKKMSPRTELKAQASLLDTQLELDGEFKYKNAYKGSLRASQEAESMYVELKSEKNDKPFYSGRVNAAMRASGVKAEAQLKRKDTELAQVMVSLNNQMISGPHKIEVTLPANQQEKMILQHEIEAGQWTASAMHLAKGEKIGFVEIVGKASGTLSNADIKLIVNGETKRKFMHIQSLATTFKHRHAITKNTLELSSSVKCFVNRKDNFVSRAVISVDTRSKASADLFLETPFIDLKNQAVTIESTWNRDAAQLKGKLTASSGKTVVITGNSSTRSGKVEIDGRVDSQIASIPSIKLNGSVDSQGFNLIVDKNGQRALQLSGKAKVDFGRSNKLDAHLEGIYNRGPAYTASVTGESNDKGGFFTVKTLRDKRDLIAAYATSEITSPDDWNTRLQLDSRGARVATFDLMKGKCAQGHPTYITTYSSRRGVPYMRMFHEDDVAPLLETIRSIRGI